MIKVKGKSLTIDREPYPSIVVDNVFYFYIDKKNRIVFLDQNKALICMVEKDSWKFIVESKEETDIKGTLE